MISKTTPPGISLEKKNKPTPIKNSHPRDDTRFIPEPFKKVARGMEEQFINYMLGQMNKSVDKAKDASSAMDYYNSLQDNERSKILANKDGGLGLQKVILNQMYPKHLRNEAQFSAQMNMLKGKRPPAQQNGAIQKYRDNGPQPQNGITLKGANHE